MIPTSIILTAAEHALWHVLQEDNSDSKLAMAAATSDARHKWLAIQV